MILGDSAGFVNMLKIKGLHNAIDSGIQAAKAIVASLDNPDAAAEKYTANVEQSNIAKEMKTAKNFRQTVAKFGPLQGMPLSVLGSWLPKFHVEKDYEAMTAAPYRLKPNMTFDKDTLHGGRRHGSIARSSRRTCRSSIRRSARRSACRS